MSQREESLGEFVCSCIEQPGDPWHLENAEPHQLLEIGGLDGSCNNWCARNENKLLPGRSWRLGFTTGVNQEGDGRGTSYQFFQASRKIPVNTKMQAD